MSCVVRILRALVVAGAALPAVAMAQTTPAETPRVDPTPYIAEYEVLRNDKPLGQGTVTLKRAGKSRWELLSVTRGTKGLASIAGVEIVEQSKLRWRRGRLETVDYSYRQEAAWRARERSVKVDARNGRIVSRDRDREYPFAFERNVLDRQAVSLAMAQDLAAGKRDELVYTVVDRDEFGPQRYRVEGEETVLTPAGSLRALRVERLRADLRGRATTSWFGIEQGFVPVRIVQREPDGDSFEMRLISLQR